MIRIEHMHVSELEKQIWIFKVGADVSGDKVIVDLWDYSKEVRSSRSHQFELSPDHRYTRWDHKRTTLKLRDVPIPSEVRKKLKSTVVSTIDFPKIQ